VPLVRCRASHLWQARTVAKWLCPCGEAIQSSGDVPNPIEWLLISDHDFGAFEGLAQSEDVYAAATHAFRCPTCDRLHIFWRGMDADPVVYASE